jgi:hypothetical protein
MSKISECEFKMNRLLKKDDGITELMYVSFGWNERDEILLKEEELEEVVLFLLENTYEAYHSEDMEVYVNATSDEKYLKYREALPGPVLSKKDAMKLSNVSLKTEILKKGKKLSKCDWKC